MTHKKRVALLHHSIRVRFRGRGCAVKLPTMEAEQLLKKHGRREMMTSLYEAATFLQKDKVIPGVRLTLPGTQPCFLSCNRRQEKSEGGLQLSLIPSEQRVVGLRQSQ